MNSSWRYRVASVLGVVLASVFAVAVAAAPPVQAAFSLLPVVGDLPFDNPRGAEFAIEATTTAVVLVAALFPMYKSRPRRILDVAMLTARRTCLALVALAAIGYFDYDYRLSRATLLVAGGVLLVTLPAWFVAIRQRPRVGGETTIIIGDDSGTMADILEAVEGEVLGYVAPPSAYFGDESPRVGTAEVADGGRPSELDELVCLGGLSRLDEVLVEHDIDTAVLAFARPDRAEFFGALDTCYEHGVAAKIHREHADVVLTRNVAGGELVDIDLEPWDPLDHVIKRAFDVVFAGVGLVVLSPVILVLALLIKADDGGPILYAQERTASFGDTFTIYKFRSMTPDVERESGPRLSDEGAGRRDPRVTDVGRVIRRTHLDEIPQLWSILVGDMSVVGPRPERPVLDDDIETGTSQWRSRWFVKPGLTGLAQIHDATSHDPEEKLRYDVEYIRRQSFWFDVKIVVRQVWYVFEDVVSFVRGG
ncbi:sugar transferase [Halorientalis litorea]|uniref:sugar transferase n=1 Tax=Halorientalis litorea TaxID=2931977 RepID=UPI001FF1379E|nr:sugar transferase [Halorientalis litorea]